MKDLHRQTHLSTAGKVNLGSFYTPEHIVKLAAEWLQKYHIHRGHTIFDPSCGYGAFLKIHQWLPENKYRGNDIDPEAVEKAEAESPFAEITCRNALKDVNRANFGITDDERLIIVGNPPYNDTTSQSRQLMKAGNIVEMDDNIRSRDLGLSSLRAYAEMQADYAAVLHPLSYLTKPANFRSAADFFSNYRILEHQIFSSREFAGTSNIIQFPVIVALYQRVPGQGFTDWQQVADTAFSTAENTIFSLANYHFLDNSVIRKYPHKQRFEPEVLFYTLRDINALRRCRTFLKERIANAVDVSPEQFPYYCYIDCFKRYADVPYYLGNADVPYIPEIFDRMAPLFIADARHHHPDIFGKSKRPARNDIALIRQYIRNAVTGSREI